MSTAVVELYNADIYQKDTLILKGVNLQINKGEFAYLIGKTGTGKSSLLKTLYAAIPLQSGIGKVADLDLSKLTWKTIPFLRRKIGIIFQDFQLLMDRNVESNLRFALEVTGWKDKKAIQQQIDNVLTTVGMNHKRNSMPYKLSGGEQQRIVIARSFLNDPQLILADEPTGNLDPETSGEIIGLLNMISKETDTAIFIGTHDYYTIQKYPGRIFRCGNSQIKEISSLYES